ncbi:MAG: hypothetical protein VX529_10385, partial [Pseudomonadota bacterium]|nr:hypothetical protein [Pseudomonadota bacterium]
HEIQCPACGGEGIIYGMEPDCCGDFAPDGSCRGHCCVPRETAEQCPDCNGQGVIIPTERQREKAQQELLTRADDLHEYLKMKGRA